MSWMLLCRPCHDSAGSKRVYFLMDYTTDVGPLCDDAHRCPSVAQIIDIRVQIMSSSTRCVACLCAPHQFITKYLPAQFGIGTLNVPGPTDKPKSGPCKMSFLEDSLNLLWSLSKWDDRNSGIHTWGVNNIPWQSECQERRLQWQLCGLTDALVQLAWHCSSQSHIKFK